MAVGLEKEASGWPRTGHAAQAEVPAVGLACLGPFWPATAPLRARDRPLQHRRGPEPRLLMLELPENGTGLRPSATWPWRSRPALVVWRRSNLQRLLAGRGTAAGERKA